MCECGCGNFTPYRSVRIGDRVLAVEIYPGCEGCKTEIAVSLNLFTEAEAQNWGCGGAPEFTPGPSDWARLDFPLLGKADLLEWLRQNPEATDGYASIEDFIADYGLEMLQGALHIRLEKARRAGQGEPDDRKTPSTIRVILINTLCEWGWHWWGRWEEDIKGRHRYCKICNLWEGEAE